ncbi:hypothetical protein KUTeg_017541 [Tegillarca granosa]|uniref:Ig-like domain-containing protein n=1 Tax=Tegillarca granosa TaxID=220873 RepID=A0ABQ9EL38_TEGGR|nr:hypothetical protein KUTeg_017541 [Tegillarca granosa]
MSSKHYISFLYLLNTADAIVVKWLKPSIQHHDVSDIWVGYVSRYSDSLILHGVPPRIISTSPSKKITVKEGETVELICNATGVPQPKITWIRKSWDSERERIRQETISKPGECLYIHNISRYCGGTFECVAHNGVQRSASAKMEIEVVCKYQK